MERVRITDIAEELGVSTATVSNVIHGKTKKISDRTVARVQKCLEERQYIPSMAGILLAQNDSRIICVVVNDHEKYEKRVLQDAFVVGSIDHFSGGYQMGCYLADMGHQDILFLADNDICMDHERYLGLQKAMEERGIAPRPETRMIIPMKKEERLTFYEELLSRFKNYTALFCASDVYAIELMNFLTDHGIRVPEDISVVGFDDIPECTIVRPRLTTVHQDMWLRARKTLEILTAWREGDDFEKEIVIPVHVVKRESVKRI